MKLDHCCLWNRLLGGGAVIHVAPGQNLELNHAWQSTTRGPGKRNVTNFHLHRNLLNYEIILSPFFNKIMQSLNQTCLQNLLPKALQGG